MTTPEFVSYLRSLGIDVWEDGGSLRCNSPQGIFTAELEAAIRARRSEILEFLRQANDTGDFSVAAIRAASRNRDIPLSFAQQRLWFLDQLDPSKAVYNEILPLRLDGSLNVDSLQKALDAVVARHEILRTTFLSKDGIPRQVVSESGSAKLKLIDLSTSWLPDRAGEIQRVLEEEAGYPFRLSSDLMLRATLVRLAPAEHILLLVLHHIATDGWSMMVLFRELAALYEAFLSGKSCPLPALPLQYADFSVWQRQWLEHGIIRKELSYWKGRLAGAPATIALPTDRPRPAVQTHRGVRHRFVLPTILTEALNELSRREGVTLFMTLLAGFKILLHRYSGQEDIVVGSPIVGRTRVELEQMIGFFANSLVLRTDLSGNPTVREILARTKETALGAYANQHTPFEKLVEELHPERDMSRNPLFQVMFGFMVGSKERITLPGLSLSPVKVNTGTARFDMFLSMSAIGDSAIGLLEYNSDLFDEMTIRRLVRHFQTVLEGMVEDSHRRISDLPLLTKLERRQVLVEWNESQRDYPDLQCVHELFEAQVDRSPESVAVTFERQQLTYSELNVRANRLAHELRSRGLRAGDLVGIFLERSLEMVIALLAVLKAGAAYVPLDPAYPSERLSFMIEDSELMILLTQEELVTKLPQHRAQVVCVDGQRQMTAVADEPKPESWVKPDDLAYVIYTSGSTGKPKGVQVPHRALANFLYSMRDDLELSDNDIMLSVTTISFDIAGLELYLPLTIGARVVLVSREVALDGKRLAASLENSQATVMQATPSTWKLLLLSGWQGSRALKILVGGEALPPDLAEALLKVGGAVWNLYGPTETTIWSTAWRVKSDSGPISIGRPIANTQVYILDRNHQPVPIGIPGEIHIGGAGVARGYLKRPELTAERFIPDPFSSRAEARLYKTGDLARYLPDGNIEFLGRIDNQVKLRGFRIELGEIESALAQHPDVQQAVVTVQEDSSDDARLTAYVVLRVGAVENANGLRSFLRSKLPEYMVPSAFVYLVRLPLTPNGKVDRRALPEPESGRPRLENAFSAPDSPVEKTIARIWTEVLKLEKIGLHDNFFDLGGHSLLLARVHSKLQQVFARELSILEMFRYPTIGALAEYFSQVNGNKSLIQQNGHLTEQLKAGKARLAQLQRRTEVGSRSLS